jgi:hypothetical protein
MRFLWSFTRILEFATVIVLWYALLSHIAMAVETTIGVSKDTLQTVKSSRDYPGQPLDELLRQTFEADSEETEDGG